MPYELMRSMNLIVQRMNNEEAYFDWITYVPDEATVEDLEGIANEKKFRDEVWKLFVEIIKEYGSDGIVW